MYPNSHQEKYIIEYYILYIISVYAFGNMSTLLFTNVVCVGVLILILV